MLCCMGGILQSVVCDGMLYMGTSYMLRCMGGHPFDYVVGGGGGVIESVLCKGTSERACCT